MSEAMGAASRQAADEERYLLSGLRVLDIATFIAGPAAATVLGDFGAEVIKVEAPGDGDPHRQLGQAHSVPHSPVNFCWQLDSRNKKSIALDLKREEGRTVLGRLIARSDVLITNFPPPVRERLGLRYEDVAPGNPRLIYASLTGYGEEGPDAGQPGFDSTAYFARSGLIDALTYEGAPPAFSLPAQGDHATAMSLFGAIMMALYRRQITGRGGWVGTSLLANGLWSNGIIAQGALLGAFLPPRPPRTKPRSALGNQYQTRDGRWLQLTIVREEKLWPPFCEAIGRRDLLDDPRFVDTPTRRDNAPVLAAILDEVFAQHDFIYWRLKLKAANTTFGVLGRMRDVPDDPQAVACGAVVKTEIPDTPRTISSPLQTDFAPKRVPHAAPGLGEHSDEILGLAGYGAAEIARLREAGVVE
jgi:crotonobetainyl-CoA:carnitine CoA-transferase CaiB-like acyl-CoA transferase